MKKNSLNILTIFTKSVLEQASTTEVINSLKQKIQESSEPFIGEAINTELFQSDLPPNIKSCWIFILKKDTPSIAHYHPNSIQHTAMIEGKGKVMVGDILQDLQLFDISNKNTWYIINENVPHEFFPEDEDMIVISFHTCAPEDLIEVKCATGENRIYKS